MGYEEQIPKLRDIHQNPVKLADVLDQDSQLVLLQNPRKIETRNGPIQNARFVSCISVVNDPPEAVKKTVSNFEHYTDFLQLIQKSEVKNRSDRSCNVEFSVGLDTPVVSPTFNYTIKYNLEGQDLTFRSVEGDFSHVLGGWEFIRLDDDRTLLSYSSWFEFSSLSWTLSTIMWAQPDLKHTIPITQATVLVRAIQNDINDMEPDSCNQKTENLPDNPTVPLFTDNGRSLESLRPLTRNGTLMKVHPNQWIRDVDDPLNVRFVTGIGNMNVDRDRAIDYSTDFASYTNYIEQVSQVRMETDSSDRKIAHWTLDLGIKILSISVRYTIEYLRKNDNVLEFRRTEGDIRYIYGALEWMEIDEQETLFFYTTATQVGSGDSFIVRLANVLPHKQIIIGVTAGAMAVKKLCEHVNSLNSYS